MSRLPSQEPLSSAGSDRTRRTHIVRRLFGRGIKHRTNRYERTTVGFGTKFDMTFDLGKERMIGPHADIESGVPSRAALTRNDVAGNYMLATKGFDAKAFTFGITSVSR